jgi:ornithine cyclodeaminase
LAEYHDPACDGRLVVIRCEKRKKSQKLLSKEEEQTTIKMEFLSYDTSLRLAATESKPPRVVSLAQIADAVAEIMKAPKLLLENQREAFLMLHRGDVSICPIQTLGQTPFQPLLAGANAQVCVKTGYGKDDNIFCIKIAAGGGNFAGNTGMLQVYCQRTLRLQCILQDEGILTEMRTAAAACLASSVLMPKEVTAVGLVGGSVQVGGRT